MKSVEEASISVIIPAYNAEKWIVRTLTSVWMQTISPSEIIVVDDCSTDNTALLAEIWSQKHPEITTRVERLESNRGVSAARNFGARLALDSNLIAFLDSDDFWFPMKLKMQVSELIRVQGCIAVGGDYLVHSERGFEERIASDWSENGLWAWLTLNRPGMLLPSTLLMYKAVFHELGGFDETLSTAADTDFALRLVIHGEVSQVSSPVVAYQLSNDQMHRDLNMLRIELTEIWAKNPSHLWTKFRIAQTKFNLDYLQTCRDESDPRTVFKRIVTIMSLSIHAPLVALVNALTRIRNLNVRQRICR